MNDEMLRKQLLRIDCINYLNAFKKLFREYPMDDAIIFNLFNYNFEGIHSKYLHFKELYLDEYNKLKIENLDNYSFNSLKPIDIRTVEILVEHGYISEFDYKKYLQRFKEALASYGRDVYLLAFNYTYNKLKQMISLGYEDPTRRIKSPIAYFTTSFDENLERAKHLNYGEEEIITIISKFFA